MMLSAIPAPHARPRGGLFGFSGVLVRLDSYQRQANRFAGPMGEPAAVHPRLEAGFSRDRGAPLAKRGVVVASEATGLTAKLSSEICCRCSKQKITLIAIIQPNRSRA